MNGGRPLRFLLLVTVGWIGTRTLMLWPTGVRTAIPAMVRGGSIVPQAAAVIMAIRTPIAVTSSSTPSFVAALPPRLTVMRESSGVPNATFVAWSAPAQKKPPAPASEVRKPQLIAGLPTSLNRPTPYRSRFFGSAWLFARDGSGTVGAVPGAQLGGAQAGVRLAYALTEDRRVAIAARAASPLGKGMRELALGVEWQPSRLPLRIVAEQRFALNEGRGGPSLSVVGGAGPVPIVAGFNLEGYGQAGVIGRDKGEAFVDGAVRLARPIAKICGIQLDLGGGAWAAAQKDASRLDIGPSLSARLPIGPQPVRLSLDWRQRIAGNARPDSGAVLTLGADF